MHLWIIFGIDGHERYEHTAKKRLKDLNTDESIQVRSASQCFVSKQSNSNIVSPKKQIIRTIQMSKCDIKNSAMASTGLSVIVLVKVWNVLDGKLC